MTHTQSPWAWQKFGTEYLLTAQHGMREIIIGATDLNANIDCCDNRVIANTVPTMNKDGICRPIDPVHPNAKLIAASPELLEEHKTDLPLLNQAIDLIKEGKYDFAIQHLTSIIGSKHKVIQKAES